MSASQAGATQRWQRRVLASCGAIGAAAALYAAAGSDAAVAPVSPASSAPASRLLSSVACAGTPSASWPPSLLSHAKVAAALSSPQEVITQVGRGVVREYHSNQYAANPAIEDTYSVIPAVAAPPGGILLGVFDGHSGKDASKWCSEELLQYLMYYRWSNRTDALIHKRAFLEADHHFLELALRDKRMQAGLSGACITVSHVSGRTVRTANAGDCRTIVGRRIRAGSKAGEASTYQAVELTSDHQIDTNPYERERLLRDHPDEEDIIRNARVKGRLQPTRGFGDGFYKRREFYNARVLSRPYAHWTPPYTTVEPDITSYDLQDADEFMVMASDGLFQDLHSQQVVELVGQWMAERDAEKERAASLTSRAFGSPAPGYLPNASSFLIRAALRSASETRFGRRRKENENVSLVLQLPLDKRRNFHDDVTVLVVFFDHQAKFPSDAPAAQSLSPAGPPQPPTLQRALQLHIKTPPSQLSTHQLMQQPFMPSSSASSAAAAAVVVPVRVAPMQDSGAAATQQQQQQQQQPQQQQIRSNL